MLSPSLPPVKIPLTDISAGEALSFFLKKFEAFLATLIKLRSLIGGGQTKLRCPSSHAGFRWYSNESRQAASAWCALGAGCDSPWRIAQSCPDTVPDEPIA